MILPADILGWTEPEFQLETPSDSTHGGDGLFGGVNLAQRRDPRNILKQNRPQM